MRRFNSGKINPVLAIVLVVLTLGASAGIGIGYQYLQGNKIDFSKEEVQKRDPDAKPTGGLSVPGIGAGDPNNVRPERTEPYKYIFSDTASTVSESGPAKTSPAYSNQSLDEVAFAAGYLEFWQNSVEHFREENSSKGSSQVDKAADLLTEMIEVYVKDGDLFPYREKLTELLKDPEIARDPLFQFYAAMVHVHSEESRAAMTLFNGSIVDHCKWNYPSRYVLPVYNERLRNGVDLRINRDAYERHVDALNGWLQYDFGESPDEQQFCWVSIGDAIKLLAQAEQLDHVKKLLDKNTKEDFVPAWLAHMMTGQYHWSLVESGTDVEKNLQLAKEHFSKAQEINPAFGASKAALTVVNARSGD